VVLLLARCSLVGAALAAWCARPALAQEANAAQANAAESVIKRLDPTDFKTRAELRYEYQEPQGPGTRQLIVPRFEYAVSKTLGFRFEVPYVVNRPHEPGVPDEEGIGDAMLRAHYRIMRGPTYALVGAVEVFFDTASEERLGTGKNVVAPLVFASIDVPQLNSVFFPFAQQFVSVSGSDDRMDINTSLLRTGLLTRWPNRFYTFVEPSLYIDWERDARTGFTLEVELGRLITRSIGVWARPGVGLWGDDIPQVYDWNFEVGFRYLFD
jgi:hypothetical protein